MQVNSKKESQQYCWNKSGTGALRTLVIYFFVANEGISILENWGSIGLPLPKKIMETLEQLKKENGGEENGK